MVFDHKDEQRGKNKKKKVFDHKDEQRGKNKENKGVFVFGS